jgi:hypothetical protein
MFHWENRSTLPVSDCTPLRALPKTRPRVSGIDLWRAKAGSNLLRTRLIRLQVVADPRFLWEFIVAQLERAMKAIKTFKLI